jgi:EmrB/QacA subfamily drug resistance transporter
MQTLSKSLTARLRGGISPQLAILIGVMTPSLMVGMDHHMFGVALPDIRATFGLDADTTAWASMIYSLPFMTLMPLYGRLGDGLGKRRLLSLGILLFLLGTAILLLAPTLTWYMVGRALQGVGTAGFVPLSIALIAQWFSAGERGKIMGTWNSIIPLSGLIFPYFGGLLVDSFGWRAIYPATALVGVVALVVVQHYIPTQSAQSAKPNFLRRFDWVGVGLLSSAMVLLLLFTSSRPLTGVEGLRDWRLLLLCFLSFAAFVFWERQQRDPYMNLRVFTNRTFTAASFCAGLRMFIMSSSSFILPLYLTDIHAVNASAIGIALALQAGMLFITSQVGGQVADRWGSRRPVLASMIGMILVLVALAVADTATPVWWIYTLSAIHGLVIGLSLAPLHRSSMQGIADQEAGAAAGLYSMIRFAGQILGVAVAGVVLQHQLARLSTPITAYQFVFWLYVIVALLATLLSVMIREEAT